MQALENNGIYMYVYTTETFLHFKLQNLSTKLHHMTDYFEGAMPLQKHYWRGNCPFCPPFTASPDVLPIPYICKDILMYIESLTNLANLTN